MEAASPHGPQWQEQKPNRHGQAQGKEDNDTCKGGHLLLRPLGMRLYGHQEESSWLDSDKVAPLDSLLGRGNLRRTRRAWVVLDQGSSWGRSPRHTRLLGLGRLRMCRHPSGQRTLCIELTIPLKMLLLKLKQGLLLKFSTWSCPLQNSWTKELLETYLLKSNISVIRIHSQNVLSPRIHPLPGHRTKRCEDSTLSPTRNYVSSSL